MVVLYQLFEIKSGTSPDDPMLICELATPPSGAVAHSAPAEIFSGEAAGTGAPVPAVPDAPNMPLSRQMGKNLFEAFQMSYKSFF